MRVAYLLSDNVRPWAKMDEFVVIWLSMLCDCDLMILFVIGFFQQLKLPQKICWNVVQSVSSPHLVLQLKENNFSICVRWILEQSIISCLPTFIAIYLLSNDCVVFLLVSFTKTVFFCMFFSKCFFMISLVFFIVCCFFFVHRNQVLSHNQHWSVCLCISIMQTSKTVHTRSKRREFNNIRHITRSRSQSHSSNSSMNSGNALNNNNSSTVLDSWCMAALCMSVVLLIWFASCSFYTAGCVLLFEATKSERRRNDLYSVCCIFFSHVEPSFVHTTKSII